MILALDVGNSNIYGGIFDGSTLRVQFRKSSKAGSTSCRCVVLSQVIGRRRLTRGGRSASADHHPIASTSGTKKEAP